MSADNPALEPEDFRWHAFFQRCTEPLFLLNRQSYLLFVNQVWERLTGLTDEQAHRLYCNRPEPAPAGADWRTVLSHLLTPTEEARTRAAGRCRRRVPAHDGQPSSWCDIDFFPFHDDKGWRGLLGKITPVDGPPDGRLPVADWPLPEAVVELRQRHARRHGLDLWNSPLPAVTRVARQARAAGRLAAPVLLVGEQGTGKRTLARAIHHQSDRQE